MKEELKKKVDTVLADTFFIDDAVGTMRGLSVMIQEFINGNTWPCSPSDSDTAERFFMNRLTDLLFFTYRTLDLTAERTQKEYVELEQKLLEVVSDEDSSEKGGE